MRSSIRATARKRCCCSSRARWQSRAFARRLLDWESLAWPMLALFVLVPAGTASMLADPPMAGLEWLSWIAFFAAGVVGLRALREPASPGLAIAHVAWLATLAIVLGLELHARAVAAGLGHTRGRRWRGSCRLPPSTLLAWRRPSIGAWPLVDEWPHHATAFLAPSGVVLLLWWTLSLLHDGDPSPLAVSCRCSNPLELMQVAVLAMLFRALAQPRPTTAAASC
jgi:hypothetical protein